MRTELRKGQAEGRAQQPHRPCLVLHRPHLVYAPLLVLFCSLALAEEGVLTGLESPSVEISLEKSAIYSGEPLEINLRVSLSSNAICPVLYQIYMPYDGETLDNIRLCNRAGTKMPQRIPLPPRHQALATSRKLIEPSQCHTIPIELHRWYSTELPAEEYTIQISGVYIEYSSAPDGCQASEQRKQDLPFEALKFTVLEGGSDCVDAYYSSLYKSVLSDDSESPQSSDRRMRGSVLINALGERASKYQLNILFEEKDFSKYDLRYCERITNALACSPSMRTLGRLVSYHEENVSRTSYQNSSLRECIGYIATCYSSCKNEVLVSEAKRFLSVYPDMSISYLPQVGRYMGVCIFSEIAVLNDCASINESQR